VQAVFFHYSEQLNQDIEASLSRDRLATYRRASANDLRRAIDLYCWNVALGSALFGPIGVLEVTLRNALDRELTRVFPPRWYDDVTFLRIDPKLAARIQAARDTIRKQGKSVTRSRLVAELPFGFWVHLLRPGPGGIYVPSLWGPALSKAFPTATKRSAVAGALDPLLKFRNRVAHHEPIFQRDVAKQYEAVLQVIELLDPKLVHWIEHHSRVRQLLAAGPYPARSRF
jgi:hypothetical protein